MTLREFLKETKLAPLLLLEGDDSYLVTTVVHSLRRSLFGHDDVAQLVRDSQEEVFRVSEHGSAGVVQRLMTSLQMLPMFATKRLLIVREAEDLDSKDEQRLLDELPQQLKSSGGDTTLLLQFAKIRANSRLKKYCEKEGVVISHAITRKPQFVSEIQAMAAAKGLKLGPDIVELLATYVPMDLSRAEQEVEKLSLYAGKNGTIDIGAASELVCATNLETVFRMTDAIGDRDPKLAMRIMSSLMERGESAQMLLAMLARHIRHLYRVKLVERLRVSRDQVAEALETQSSFVIEKATRQARRFELSGLRRAIRRLFEVDLEMKRSGLAVELVLERLVFEFCNLPGRDSKPALYGRP